MTFGRLNALAFGRSGVWTLWPLDALACGRSGLWTLWRLDALALWCWDAMVFPTYLRTLSITDSNPMVAKAKRKISRVLDTFFQRLKVSAGPQREVHKNALDKDFFEECAKKGGKRRMMVS